MARSAAARKRRLARSTTSGQEAIEPLPHLRRSPTGDNKIAAER
jgi:hypothetical protein